MCPLCIGAATWILAGGSSAGGVGALIAARTVRQRPRRYRAGATAGSEATTDRTARVNLETSSSSSPGVAL